MNISPRRAVPQRSSVQSRAFPPLHSAAIARENAIPEADSEQLMKLCAALAAPASSEADMPSEAEIRESFLACDDIKTTDKEQLRANFSALISAAGLNISKLCRQANYDVSTVFRFRSGERQPSDPEHFASDVAAFTARELDSETDLQVLAHLIGAEPGRAIRPLGTLYPSA